MNFPNNLIALAIKRLLFFTLPIVLFLYILYEIILGYEMENLWRILIPYIVIVTIATISSYTNKTREEELEDKEWLDKLQESKRWTFVENSENKLVIRPHFDYPYNILSKETVSLKYSDEKATIEGPRYYVDQMTKDLKGRSSKWSRNVARMGAFLLGIIIVSIPVIFESGMYWDMRTRVHNYQMRNVSKIEIQDARSQGNTVDNSNNYGSAAESGEFIFYVEGHLNLVRYDKNLEDKKYLIQRSGGNGIGRLNVVEDWIFYSSGESYKRMRLDGSGDTLLYKMGYVLEPQIIGSWIYFINYQDNWNVYRMDVNGQNLHRFVQEETGSISTYDDRLFFSHGKDGEGIVESIALDGGDRQVEFITDSSVRSLTRYGDNYYYINGDFRLIRAEIGAPEFYQVAVDDNVSSYIVTDVGIFYSLHSEDVGYPGDGLYRMDHFGLDKTLVSDTEQVEGLAYVGDWLLFQSYDEKMMTINKRIDLITGEIHTME